MGGRLPAPGPGRRLTGTRDGARWRSSAPPPDRRSPWPSTHRRVPLPRLRQDRRHPPRLRRHPHHRARRDRQRLPRRRSVLRSVLGGTTSVPSRTVGDHGSGVATRTHARRPGLRSDSATGCGANGECLGRHACVRAGTLRMSTCLSTGHSDRRWRMPSRGGRSKMPLIGSPAANGGRRDRLLAFA
jgi:hypothetical protein